MCNARCVKWFVSLWLVVSSGGCTPPADRPGPYSLELQNRTGGPLRNCTAYWGDLSVAFGTVVANGNASYGLIQNAIPDSVRLVWADEDEALHQTQVRLKPAHQNPLEAATFVLVLFPDSTAAVDLLTEADYQDPERRFAAAHREQPAYVVGVQNATRDLLRDIRVEFGELEVCGAHSANHDSTNHGWTFTHGLPYATGPEARVRWTAPDGVRHERLVELQDLPTDLKGVCLAFVIGDDGRVSFRTVRWKDLQAASFPDIVEQ